MIKTWHSVKVFLFVQMVDLSQKDRTAQFGTAPIHRKPVLAFTLSPPQSTQTFPPALFPSPTQKELCGLATCFPRPAFHLRPPLQTAGPTVWTPRAWVATPMSTTSTTLTPTHTSTPGTTTQCFIHTQPTALRWIPGLILCCCLVLGTRISLLPIQRFPQTARGWRQR